MIWVCNKQKFSLVIKNNRKMVTLNDRNLEIKVGGMVCLGHVHMILTKNHHI